VAVCFALLFCFYDENKEDGGGVVSCTAIFKKKSTLRETDIERKKSKLTLIHFFCWFINFFCSFICFSTGDGQADRLVGGRHFRVLLRVFIGARQFLLFVVVVVVVDVDLLHRRRHFAHKVAEIAAR